MAPDVELTRYVPECPVCDWTGEPTTNMLAALTRADRHIATDHAPLPAEPLSPFAAAVEARDQEDPA